jgi:hypothetical protein
MLAQWKSRAYSIINREFDIALSRSGEDALYKTRDRLANDLESAYRDGRADGWWLSWAAILAMIGTLFIAGAILYKKSFLIIWP